MNWLRTNPATAILIAVAAFVVYPQLSKPVDDKTPAVKPEGPDLRSSFSTNDDRAEARRHAVDFATICEAFADQVEYDLQRTDRRYKTGAQLDDLRLAIRQYRMGGFSFLTKYPELGGAVEGYLKSQVGTSGGPLTDDDLKKWTSAMRQLGKCSRWAAEQG